MSQITAIIIMLILYVLLPCLLLFGLYWGYKKLTKPKTLAFKELPKLSNIKQTSLPTDVLTSLNSINEKGETLKRLYGDTNEDGKIDNKDAKNETYVIVNKLLDNHITEAINDYQNLNDLGKHRTEKQVIQSSNMTGKEALMEILNTVDVQFDELLDAAYQSNAQKLLVTNRYLQSRFDNLNT